MLSTTVADEEVLTVLLVERSSCTSSKVDGVPAHLPQDNILL
jgi:hypothetical protein